MNKSKINPLYDRIVVQQLEVETVSHGGIVLTGEDAEKRHEGLVLAVGKGRETASGEIIPVGIVVGDKVLFGQDVGQEATIDGTEYLILNEEEIIAILV